MPRILFVLLTGLFVLLIGTGIGLLVAGSVIAPPRPIDPADVVERVFRQAPADSQQAAVQMNQLTLALTTSMAQYENSFGRDADDRRIAAAAMKGFGSAMLVVGSLGLAFLLLTQYRQFTERRTPTA
jgi:hypothetical protein